VEMGLFEPASNSATCGCGGTGRAEIEVSGGQLPQNPCFFATIDLPSEMLSLVSQRCKSRATGLIGLLLDGIAAAHRGRPRAQLAAIAGAHPAARSTAEPGWRSPGGTGRETGA